MKTVYYVYLFIFISYIPVAQTINIPDANFKAKLLQADGNLNNIAGYGTFGNWTYCKIDTNDDGEIQVSEAQLINFLLVPNSQISNLNGIEYFVNLNFLSFALNSVSNVNLSNLTSLESLGCFNNQLTSLNLSGLNNLRNVTCFNNQLTSIDFTGLPNLELVYCNNNLVTSLDFRNNPIFKELECANNPLLTSITIKNGYQQLFGIQTLYNQCWTGCPSLNHICADSFEIPALQADLASCGINTSGITIDSNCALGVEEYEQDKLVLFPNPATNNVNINCNSNIKKVELLDVQGRLLATISVNSNQTMLDISGYTKGVYFVKVTSDNDIKTEKVIKE